MPRSKAFVKTHQQELFVAILLLIASLPTIFWMWDRWFAEDSYYSHGILVPIVSLFLIWKKREALKEIPPVPSPWGLRLFVFGIIFYWISALLHVYFTSAFSMLIVTAGLVLHFYGEKTLKEIRFPLLFLVFMIPLPLIVVAFICFKLKIIAAQLATFILNLIGLPAVQQSSIIKLSHSYVLVEDSCGGFRSLISLTALGCIFAYRLKLRLFKKMVLFFTAIPIAVITNACRIVFLSAVGEIWGTEYTQGFVHDLSGYLVFVFAFLLLFAAKKLMTQKRHGQS
jgi:exosortase